MYQPWIFHVTGLIFQDFLWSYFFQGNLPKFPLLCFSNGVQKAFSSIHMVITCLFSIIFPSDSFNHFQQIHCEEIWKVDLIFSSDMLKDFDVGHMYHTISSISCNLFHENKDEFPPRILKPFPYKYLFQLPIPFLD